MEMTRPTAKIFAALLAIATTLGTCWNPAAGQLGPLRLVSTETPVAHTISQPLERIEMLVKSSRILKLESRIPKFQVHNESVLGASPISTNQIQIFAKSPGSTQLNLWDTEDNLYTVEVTVEADAREVEGILSSQLPFASLKVMPVNNSAIISGTVTSVDDVDNAVAIVEQFYPSIVNNIKVVGVQQVLLHTRIMEVSRTKLRDLGIDWASVSTDSFFYSAPSQFIDVTRRTIGLTPEASLNVTNRFSGRGGDFEALISALRKQGLVKFLAEPTVVATHGRPARFNVGGKVPYIVPTGNNAVAINYEEFGTAVDFLPFVVGPGRIRLEVRPEVTEPDPTRGIQASGISVPAFSSRYVETAVELQAGQTFAIAGLLQSRTEAVSRATPFLGEIPVIGSMFRRVRDERNDIELLITVTPELVDAMDPHEVPRGGPGLNSISPCDHELYVQGHIEVPNLLGNDPNCNPEGFSHDYSLPPNAPTADSTNRTEVPADAVIPTAEPIVVGEGVTVEAPSE